MKTGPDYFLAHYSTSVDSQETKLNREASTGPIFDLKSAVSILGGVTLTKCFSNPSAPLNTATCSDILNTDGWWAAFPHSSSEKGLRNATANSRWASGKCLLSGRQNSHYSVWRWGFPAGPEATDVSNGRRCWANGASPPSPCSPLTWHPDSALL